MIICLCRAISTDDYTNIEELRSAILKDDFVCGSCITKINWYKYGEDVGIEQKCIKRMDVK